MSDVVMLKDGRIIPASKNIVCNIVLSAGPNKGKRCCTASNVCKNYHHAKIRQELGLNKKGKKVFKYQEENILKQELEQEPYKKITIDKILSKDYIDFNINTGYCCSLIGSGKSGKSTLLNKLFKGIKDKYNDDCESLSDVALRITFIYQIFFPNV